MYRSTDIMVVNSVASRVVAASNVISRYFDVFDSNVVTFINPELGPIDGRMIRC